jgi:asparagine synthase (glutamine-hydrolysing)
MLRAGWRNDEKPMSAFAGIVFFDSRPVDSRTQDRVAHAVPRRQGSTVRVQCDSHAVFAQRIPLRDAQSLGSLPSSRHGRALFAASARIDNRHEVAAALGLERPAGQASDADLVLHSIERAGDAGLGRLVGDFSFAYWDRDARELMLGRDCLGRAPLFFHAGRGFAAFASSYSSLFALPDVPRQIDEVMLGHFLALNLWDLRRTLYRGIERVPSRMVVTVNRRGYAHRHYWTPNLDAAPIYRTEDDYVARGRELLDQAVATAMGDEDAALLMSGGLDSSGIAATACRLGLADRLDCYTMTAPADTQVDFGKWRYRDERDKVEVLARMYPQLRIHYYAPPINHPLDADPTRFFVQKNSPARNASIIGLYDALIATATAKHRTLLDGACGNLGLSWDGQDALFDLFRTRQWPSFIKELNATARRDGRGMARTFYTGVVSRAMPHRVRRMVYRLKGRDPDSVERYSALNPAFFAEHDFAAKFRADDFDPWFSEGNRMRGAALRAYYMFDHNQFSRDATGTKSEIMGIEQRSPLGDRRLLEFVLTVPEPMFCKNGVGRSFARRVLADRLPREIVEETRFGVPETAWFRILDAQRESLRRDLERIEASALARRMLDIPRLKRLMDEWPKNEQEAQSRAREYQHLLARGIHVGRFIRWVEGGNA